MPTLTFAIPIPAGQAEAWRRLAQELIGSRCAAHTASRGGLGIQGEMIGLAEGRAGELVIVRLVAGDPEAALRGLAGSAQPFDHWFREQWLALAGCELARSARTGRVAPIFEWNAAERSATAQKPSEAEDSHLS